MTYFFDNNISRRIVGILKLLDVDALHLQEVFPENAQDVDWLPRAGQEGWIVVTVDHATRRRTSEYEAMRRNKVAVLFLQKSFLKRTKWPHALWLVTNWPKIEAQGLKPGAIMEISDNGKK